LNDLKLDPKITKSGNINALHLAASNNNLPLMKKFIALGISIESPSSFGTPLNWAIGSQHVEAAKLLLQKGCNPNG
jgi:ankyrin repeat protein